MCLLYVWHAFDKTGSFFNLRICYVELTELYALMDYCNYSNVFGLSVVTFIHLKYLVF